VGTSQSEDKLVYENKNFPLRNYYAAVTDDERFLILYGSETTTGNSFHVMDLSAKNPQFTAVVEGFDNDYGVIDNIDEKLLVRTNYQAPKYQLLVIDPTTPGKENWKTILSEQEEVLEGITLIGGKIVAEYMKDASSRAFIYDMEGKKTADLNLPGIGTLSGLNGHKDDNIAFYGFTSFTFPSTIYKYDIEKNESSIYRDPQVDFDASLYETKQIFYESKDGTKVPMFIVHKKGLEMNGKNPTLLYGYGGFNASMTPGFSTSRLILLEQGGIFAMANLRGGGEYGEDWHLAGTKERKQNVFDDFIAAAEYLIQNKYTSSDYLAINGGSNGGLLVGACMVQRPDLFKVALPAVGVLDMLRYHLFTIGWAWVSDYGSSENAEDFTYLIKYSPLHNLKPGTCYPATLVTTADHDDRVVPAHSFKFISTLQAAQGCYNPVVIRIDTKAGHGAGKPTAKTIEELSDIYSFIFYNMGITPRY
jgi:prolyl oligopeptidase